RKPKIWLRMPLFLIFKINHAYLLTKLLSSLSYIPQSVLLYSTKIEKVFLKRNIGKEVRFQKQILSTTNTKLFKQNSHLKYMLPFKNFQRHARKYLPL